MYTKRKNITYNFIEFDNNKFFIIFYAAILRKLKFINLQLIFYSLFMIFIPFLIKPVEASESLKSLFINAGILGKWSFFWYIFLIFVLGTDREIFYTNLKSNKFNYRLLYLVVSLLIFILIYMMSFFRVPYRLGYGDSGNRLLITIYPFAYIYIVNCIYKIKNIKNSFFFTK